jgi:D-alanyl-lipoteichoic acid acyltransferase DltB (MBOAT superfamily)
VDNSPLVLASGLVIYILASRLVMRSLSGGSREVIVALLNLAGVYVFFYSGNDDRVHHFNGSRLFVECLCLVVVQYVALRIFSDFKGWLIWLAFFCPIAALISVRYLPFAVWGSLSTMVYKFTRFYIVRPAVVGISYLAFRCSRLVLEVRNGCVKKPGFWQYLGFAFFVPIMPLGPINTYANFRRGFDVVPWEVPVGRAALRVLVGLVKYQFLGGMCNQLTYQGFLLNGHPHHRIDLPIAMAFYYLYLYCNFSGFCDMAIGAAALIGIPVLENFNNPFAARNMRDFWNRWHITLSHWMRDIVFAPLSKFLVRVMGPARVNYAIALTIFFVFLLIGIWHGVGWNYAIFGLFQALGVAANFYYTIGLKKWLGKDGFKAYNESRCIHAVAVVSTFCYYAATLFFFANTLPEMKEILSELR